MRKHKKIYIYIEIITSLTHKSFLNNFFTLIIKEKINF